MTTARKIAFSLVPLCALLAVGEAGLRLVGAGQCEAVVPQATGWETMVGDPHLLWKLEPGRLFESPGGNTQINSVGLRTRLLPQDRKTRGEKRILVTGDSSVYGWGQPDGQTYAEQLERTLDDMTPNVRVRVINLGIPGYSTEQTIRLLDRLGWDYEPDLLVVHNIFSDCNIDAFQDRTALEMADPEGTATRRLLHSSRVYCTARAPWVSYQARVNQQPNRVLMPGRPAGPNAAVALEKIDQVIDLSRVPLDDYLDNLDTIRTQAQARGAGMVVAPLAQEWDVGIWRANMPKPTEGQVLPWYPYREALRGWADAQGIGHVDLPTVFAGAAEPNRLFMDQMHPTVEGGRVMAEAIADHVRQNPGLLGLDARDIRRGGHRPAPDRGHPPPPR